MDQELVAFLDRRFEATRCHLDLVAEDLRGEIRAVAGGRLGLSRQLRALRREGESSQRELLAAIKFPYADG